MRPVWLLLGLFSLGLGLLGAFLPLVPTVPFLLLASFFFARSSHRLHRWLHEHPLFGSMLTDWHHRGAISQKAKLAATVSILLVPLFSLYLDVHGGVLAAQIIVLTAVLVFIWSRPE
jgi:uncharacterized membrane protein YbaN (DUF454 family)